MIEFNPHNINGYSFEELMGFLDSKKVTFDDLRRCWLNHEMQDRIRGEYERRNVSAANEEKAWRAACNMNTIQGYEMYLKKYSTDGIHAFEAEVKIDEIKEKMLQLYEDLFADMHFDLEKYQAPIMRILFNKTQPTEAQKNEDSPRGRFLNAGLKLTFQDLINHGLLPADNLALQESILHDNYPLPQMNVDQLGSFPTDRTDIYFLGCPSSGKTCVLAGFLNYMRSYGQLQYEVQYNEETKDLCKEYYDKLIESVSLYKAPQSTAKETVSYLKFNIGPNYDRKINAVELSGEAFNDMANALSSGREVWERLGAGQCLHNDTKKTLFFLLDYSTIIGKNSEFSEVKQALILENALTVFRSDGEGPTGEINCTMSKVQTMAIIVTKSDMMDEQEGRALTPEERADIAMDYLKKRFMLFMNNLSMLCKKYGINANNKKRYQPFVTTFSLGKFYVGNSVAYDDADSARLANFIMACTDKERRSPFDFIR